MTTKEYKALIGEFLNKILSAREFQARYMAAFSAETGSMDASLFWILEALFEEVDAYSPRILPGQETAFLISEEQLRHEARKALARLEHLEQDGAATM